MRSGGAAIDAARAEAALQRALTAWIVSGLFFMLLPGTFLGVWSLFSITRQRSLQAMSAAWLQAHGHAQVFGWVGSFILGIGFYSLSKMAGLAPFAVGRSWAAWGLWTVGVALRWVANITGWHWRVGLPVSAGLELGGFLLFFSTVARHRPARNAGHDARAEAWMLLVIAGAVGLLAILAANLALAVAAAARGDGPALAHGADQRLLTAIVWVFLAPTIWGFSARWLPIFLGSAQPSERGLKLAYGLAFSAVAAALAGAWVVSSVLAAAAAAAIPVALRLWRKALKPPKTAGVHASFPAFVRVAYVWLMLGAGLSVWAAVADRSGGIWGASRHAITVGFVAMMVLTIGQRVLPAFCGARVLYSPRLMLAALGLLAVGCTLRVATEPLAYQGYAPGLWPVLPVSAVLELSGITLFALNLGVTLLRPPEHVRLRTVAQRT